MGGVIFKSSSRPTYRELAEHWSPFIYQATTGRHDYITKFDFDGNWVGHDNWENYECYPLPAYVYYAVVESTNYYFLTYSFFHPRDDGNPLCNHCSRHENDFEGCRVIIKKDGSYWGSLFKLDTIAHHERHSYDPQEITKVNGDHPAVYVKDRKHSVYGTNHARQLQDCYGPLHDLCRVFPSVDGTGIGYWYAGRGAEIPESVNDRDVSYELIELTSTIWERRFEDPFSSNCNFVREPLSEEDPYPSVVKFGAEFQGDNYSENDIDLPEAIDTEAGPCASTPPWSYGLKDVRTGADSCIYSESYFKYGKWFIHPLIIHQDYDGGRLWDKGERYIYNPFLYSSDRPPSACESWSSIVDVYFEKIASSYRVYFGGDVTYYYSLTNNSHVPITNIEVYDDKLGTVCSFSSLQPGQSHICERTVKLTQTTTNGAWFKAVAFYNCRYHNIISRKRYVTVEVVPYIPLEDSDFDGIPDVNDNCPFTFNPDQTDSDQDGIGNLCDNCPYTYNPDQIDSDGDGIGDVCQLPPEPPEPPVPPEPEPIMFWDMKYSFLDSIHSLEHWAKARTSKMYINERGFLEIEIYPSDSPHIISSPYLGEYKGIDEIRILYSNQIEYKKGKAKGRVGWLNEMLFDKNKKIISLNKMPKEGMFMDIDLHPTPKDKFKWVRIKLKQHKNWNRELKTYFINFTPAEDSKGSEGKFLIWRIELIKSK